MKMLANCVTETARGAGVLPLNFSLAAGLSLFLSGCHFSAALRYAFLISSCVAVGDTPKNTR